MKSYSRKQAGAIFGNWKRGNIEADEKVIGWLYDYADVYSVNWQDWELDMVRAIRGAVDAVFSNDYEEAQKGIDRFAMIHEQHLD